MVNSIHHSILPKNLCNVPIVQDCIEWRTGIVLKTHFNYQGKGSNWDLFPNQYKFIQKVIFYNRNDSLFLKSPLTPIVTNSTA